MSDISIKSLEHQAQNEQWLAIVRQNSESAYHNFMRIDIDVFKSKIKEDQVWEIVLWHRELMFVNNKELMLKLKQMGLRKTELKWFVSMDLILKELEIIRTNGIIFYYYPILESIQSYFISKFRNQMLDWGKFFTKKDDVRMSMFSKIMHDIHARKKFGDGNLKLINSTDAFVQNFTNIYLSSLPVDISPDNLLKISNGKTEHYFLDVIVRDCFNYKAAGLSQNKYLASLYNLFQLILQDHTLPTIVKPNWDKKEYNSLKAKKIRTYVLANKPL